MWDPKPDAPSQVRGPYGTIPTAVPGVRFCEHLHSGKQRSPDKLTVVRSMDCSASNHTPITMQAGNPLARRTDDGKDGAGYPAMGSVAARFRGSNDASLPAFVGLADSWAADVWGAGELGSAFAPVKGTDLAGQFVLPAGVTLDRLQDRNTLRREIRPPEPASSTAGRSRKADRATPSGPVEMISSGKARSSWAVKTRGCGDAYGRDSLGESPPGAALVESNVTFMLINKRLEDEAV